MTLGRMDRTHQCELPGIQIYIGHQFGEATRHLEPEL
jgi:hypothetical protein